MERGPPVWELVVAEMVQQTPNEDIVLVLRGYGNGGAVQVVPESGVGKDVQKVHGIVDCSLPTGQEERSLALKRGGEAFSAGARSALMRMRL